MRTISTLLIVLFCSFTQPRVQGTKDRPLKFSEVIQVDAKSMETEKDDYQSTFGIRRGLNCPRKVFCPTFRGKFIFSPLGDETPHAAAARNSPPPVQDYMFNPTSSIRLIAFHEWKTNEKSNSVSSKFARNIKDNPFTLRLQYKF